MSLGLFNMLAGFLLPLGLALRLGDQLVAERGRGLGHPLPIALVVLLMFVAGPLLGWAPALLTVTLGDAAQAGTALLDYAGTTWGTVRMLWGIVAVLLADLFLPRICDQLGRTPASVVWPSRTYFVRDGAMVVICLLLAAAAAWRG